jgi:hypothetical protein
MFSMTEPGRAQGVAINNSGADPDGSAMLDVSSFTSGMLVPRMTEEQKNDISTPATGLLVYQTDGNDGFWYYNGLAWSQIGGGSGGGLANGTDVGNIPYWDGTQWIVSSGNLHHNGSSVGIGTPTPHSSAILDLSSTTKGFALPRMTTAERDAILTPETGLQIVNTTTKCIEVYLDPMWQNLFCGCLRPPTPTLWPFGIGRSPNRLRWGWQNDGSGGTIQGYKYNTVNDYSTAIDVGNNITVTQTGLSCGTTYTIYVWAYGPCMNSATPLVLTASTSSCFSSCGNSVSFTYKGSNVNYGTVVSASGNCFMDRNLGALQVATSTNDSNAYGDLFQWGRPDDGHQTRTSPTTTTLSTSDVPGNSNFIVTSAAPNDWRNPQNSTLWQGPSGINNPCPAGWRIPTLSDWQLENDLFSSQNLSGAFASPLKITGGGVRNTNGTISFATSQTRMHSSTATNTQSMGWIFSTGSNSTQANRAEGLHVRCLRD